MTAPGTAFEMEERLIAGGPTRVWKHGPKTLRDVFTAGRAHGDKTFLVHEDDRASFDAFARAALAIAHALADAGVAKGDRVALAMRNLPEWPAAFFGAVLTGAIAVPLNAWWTAAELEYALQDSGAKLAIVDAERLARLAPALARCPGLQAVWVARSVGTPRHDDRRVRALHAITGAVADWPSLPDRPLPAVDLQPDDDATIFYTSGTTSQPKGALGTHRNATTCIVAAGFSPQRNFVRRGEPVPRPEDRRTQRASLVGIPFFHVTGCFAWLGPALTTGGKLVTLHRWDTERAFALIERERCTQAGGVPTLAWQLLEHPARGSYDLSSLESLSYGGAPAGAELVRRIHDVFPAAVAGIGWGMTETTATFTHQGAEDYLQRPDSCGPALPVCDMQVVDGAGRALPAGQVGELWARGPNIVKGYWNKEQATAETFIDGWVRTGDIARIDHEGFLFIVDRKKDMLIRGGENIYCVEVEDALYAHPAVMDAGVVGLPHRTLGEEPAAVVTLKPGTDATEDALRDWVRGRLAPFKVPVRVVTLREPLPRNANGKIIKKALLPLFSDTAAPCNNEELRMATDFVKTTVDAGIAVLTMDKPPVNGLGFELRTAIAQALDAALADPDVQAIVLTGTARAFSGGADVTEFGTPKTLREPMLRSLIAMLEDSPKPVVAAIAGSCLGGGLELAMGAHFRVAAADAQLGLPEVKLGLLPGSGGTQRLPRLLGPGGLEMALNMIVGGAAVAASDLRGTALIDGIADGDVVTAAVAFARKAVADKLPLRRARDLKVQDPQAEAFLQFARNTVGATSKNFPAPLKCVEVVGLALTKPFDDALRLEREAFLALMQTPESRALRHVFAAERAAGKIDGLPDAAALRRIASVGVIGAGTMGGGIAMNFLNAGLSVVLLETKQEALDKGVATIRRNYENTLKKGKLTQAQLDERMALLTPTLDYAGFANVDLVVEAVFENMDVKQQVFRTLDEVCKPGAILASNTSYLNVDTIAGFTKRQADVLGLHFFSPANVMRLLEVVRGAKTAPDVLATCMALAKKIRKVAVVSGVCDGFIGNRMLARYGAAAAGLIDAGALPQQVDAALQQFGMAMGPFRVGDLAGLDIGWATRKRKAAEAGVEHKAIVADKLCEAGRFGQKTGAGWYRYAAGQRDPLPDPVVEGLIAQYRQDNGLMPRKISGDEIVQRCVYALVNEGARILEEGIAARASDIDLVYLNGYGFPLHRGGPMLYADTVGLPNVVRALRRFAAEPGADASWQPAPLLLRLAEEGRTFN